jgi:acetolactate synthase-1/2/3 large subunit
MQTGARLAELLVENGVRHVFGVPGGQTLPLYDGISKFQGRIEHVLMRDERSAGFAADAYARCTGRVGVCDATVGPGATNFLSPLAEAYCASIPLLAIIADIPRGWEHLRIRGNASQAMEQLDMFKSVSKWQVRVTDPTSIDSIVEQAFRVATTGRPGPVVVCVPVDVARADIEFSGPVASNAGAVYPRFRSAPDPEQLVRAAELLRDARKPLLLVGGGVHISGCGRQVRDFMERVGAAMITTISGKGTVEETHPQVFGVTGGFGNPAASAVCREADVILLVGCKAGQVTTFNYASPSQNQTVIHLDVDGEEIGRNYPDCIPLLGDAKLGLEALLAELGGSRGSSTWDFSAHKAAFAEWYAVQTNPANAGTPLRPQPIMGVVNEMLGDDDVIVCDASLASGWAAQYLNFSTAGKRFLAPRGLAGLGWGTPAAIGASLAAQKGNRVLQIAGDGGFSFSVQELEVMVRFKLPVVSLILNNDTLGWIKHVQRDHYEENYVSTDYAHVDFATVARGFGARGYTVNTLEELRDALAEESSPDGPAVIEIISDQWESPVQALSYGK